MVQTLKICTQAQGRVLEGQMRAALLRVGEAHPGTCRLPFQEKERLGVGVSFFLRSLESTQEIWIKHLKNGETQETRSQEQEARRAEEHKTHQKLLN